MKEYADPVIDWLDAGRGILALRFFREVSGVRIKWFGTFSNKYALLALHPAREWFIC